MKLAYDLACQKQKRIIVDTDAACEADDPFAIAHALMCKSFDVRAITAIHFASPGSMEQSHGEIVRVLEAMDLSVPALRGQEGPFQDGESGPLSEASRFIIDEAMKQDSKPLFILCLGAITNVAAALKARPEIAERMTVVWIGGHGFDSKNINHREYNAGNDVEAVNVVLDSPVTLWIIPNNVYGTMHIGLAEIQDRIAPCGKIGKHLYENMLVYINSPRSGWAAPESWALGDSPAVGVVLEPNCGQSVYREAPVLLPDTSWRFEPGRRMVRVYQTINSRFILEDLISKLRILYG